MKDRNGMSHQKVFRELRDMGFAKDGQSAEVSINVWKYSHLDDIQKEQCEIYVPSLEHTFFRGRDFSECLEQIRKEIKK